MRIPPGHGSPTAEQHEEVVMRLKSLVVVLGIALVAISTLAVSAAAGTMRTFDPAANAVVSVSIA
jgi:hypothetical protein